MIFHAPGGKGIRVRFDIPGWLIRPFVALVLLYRRMRYGYAFRLIRMAQPKYAKVDPADYKRLRKYEWRSKKSGRCFHAIRQVRIGKSAKFTVIYMHREVIQVPEGMVVDHINHDGMDNRRANVRAATHAQNTYHRKKRSGVTQSKYKGIHWRKEYKKWVARIMFEGKRIYLGSFRNEIEAAKAYDRAAMKYHGEFASLNFPS